MNLTLGSNIKRIRLERGLTQEEMAGHLGISFQSVSKWERGEGYPDIELLPSLSSYLGLSVDALLGCTEAENKEKYDRINKEWAENNREGRHKENEELMKTALKGFPNDPLLLVQLATSLEKIGGTDAERERYLRESVAVQEQIISFCPDCEVRGATLYNICFAYSRLGEQEKALSQAEKLPNLYKARENALSYFLSGEEKRENSLEALTPLAWCIARHMTTLSETENNPLYRENAVKIIELLFENREKDGFIEKMLAELSRK